MRARTQVTIPASTLASAESLSPHRSTVRSDSINRDGRGASSCEQPKGRQVYMVTLVLHSAFIRGYG